MENKSDLQELTESVPSDVNVAPSISVQDANNAALFFKQNIHQLREKMNALNKAALMRVMTNIVGFPLVEKQLFDKRESDAYNLANMLIDAKSVMIMFSAEQKALEQEKQAQEPQTEEKQESVNV